MTFSMPTKIQDCRQNLGNSTFFRGTISKVSSTQWVQNLLEHYIDTDTYCTAEQEAETDEASTSTIHIRLQW